MNLADIMKIRHEVEKEDNFIESDMIRDKLNTVLSTKVRTTFIGALATFEEIFGWFWGHNELKLTEEQKAWRKLWDKARKGILDKGNDQIKLVKNELENYEYSGRKFNCQFKPMGGNDESRV